MNELEILYAEKKRIESRIRELKQQDVRCGRARLVFNPQEYAKDWRICFKTISVNSHLNTADCYKTFIHGRSRDEVVEKLDEVIADLTALRYSAREMFES